MSKRRNTTHSLLKDVQWSLLVRFDSLTQHIHKLFYTNALSLSPAPLHHAGDSVNLSSCLRTALSHLILPPSYSFLRVFIPKHSLSSALTFEGKNCVSPVL